MSSASAASFADASAPESASSVDGLTRSMLAMTLFNQAKGEYDALKASREAAADPDGALLKAFHERWAVQCHDFAVNHGGVYIKAAQFIASLQGGAGEAGVPREYVEALRPLTDRVPPRPFEAVAPVAEEELGQPLGELLASIDQTPIAAASLAQVHKGRLLDPNAKTRSAKGGKDGGGGGDVVAMKLQYPSLREQVEADFMVLQTMQTMAAPSGYDFSWLLADLQKYVTSELDFTTEAKNAMAAAEALRSLAPSVLVPRVVGELSATRVMATEFVEGLTRLDRPTELAALGLDRLEIGALAAAAFSELALVNGLVHGDPHSGNVYTRPLPGGGGAPRRAGSTTVPAQLVILDHGLYHRLTDADRLGMCDLVLACATPWPSRARVRALAKRFAGGLAPLFPALLSPAFAFSTGLSLKQLRAAAEGRLPAGTTLDDVWQTLVEMHAGESDVLGLLHSMGYVRGLLNAFRSDGLSRRVRPVMNSVQRVRDEQSAGTSDGTSTPGARLRSASLAACVFFASVAKSSSDVTYFWRSSSSHEKS